MLAYKISPYVEIIENRLIPTSTQYAAFHRLTGYMISVSDRWRHPLSIRNPISLTLEDLAALTAEKAELRSLILAGFVIPVGDDPLAPFPDWIVVRPIQNPAVAYSLANEDWFVVRTSMAEHVFSPDKGELPPIIEERLPSLAAEIFLLADGSRTLRDIFKQVATVNDSQLLFDRQFQLALDFLTHPERQLIKFASPNALLDDPYQPFNTVPRNLYRCRHKSQMSRSSDSSADFHRGIEDASWEFDFVEPTVNHAFRFPSAALGGLDYGARFCLSALRSDVLPQLGNTAQLRILEVGGGTGSFAKSFLKQATELSQNSGAKAEYQILELSPALIKSQAKLLAHVEPCVQHICQDATMFDLPGQKFDLIIANEVAADFPIALAKSEYDEDKGQITGSSKRRRSWSGDGAPYVKKYDLADEAAPDSFLVNVGALQFIERCRQHLAPGGTIILTEYGNESQFPVQAFHLNHAEFSIHFGHLKSCAEFLGLECRLMSLKEFLDLDDDVSMLAGHEEHIMCLNNLFSKFGASMSYRAYSRTEFENEFGDIVKRTKLTGLSFIHLWNGFHYGPRVEDFHVLMMNKPCN